MQKQIEEMAKIIGENSWEGITRPECYVCAEALYNAGYYKVDEFRKDQAEVKFLKKQIQEQTARELLNRFRNKRFTTMEWDRVVPWDDIEEIIEEEYGVEVGV